MTPDELFADPPRRLMTAAELLAKGRAAAALLDGLPWAEVNLGAGLCVEHVRELAQLAGANVHVHVYASLSNSDGTRAPAVIEAFQLQLPGPVLIRAASTHRAPTAEELTALGEQQSITLNGATSGSNGPESFRKP